MKSGKVNHSKKRLGLNNKNKERKFYMEENKRNYFDITAEEINEFFQMNKADKWLMETRYNIKCLLEKGYKHKALQEYEKYKVYLQALEDTEKFSKDKVRLYINPIKEHFRYYADMEV